MSGVEGERIRGSPLKNSNEPAGHRATQTPHDITAWPFVERRKAERRQQDRGREAEPTDAWPGPAMSMCTRREQQTVQLLLRGMTNKQIAQRLDIAEDTVKKHLHHVYKKLGVGRRALLIVGRASATSSRRSTTFVE